MSPKISLRSLVTAALLCAIGIIIPMFSPIRVLLEPASFTLGVHVPIFIAMFISPGIGGAVALGAALGFLFGGFPLVIVARALTHCAFAVVGARMLQKEPELLTSFVRMPLLLLYTSLLHAICEVAAVVPFYFGNNMAQGWYKSGFAISVLLLVGLGTVVHHVVDFYIALIIWKPLQKHRGFGRT